VNANRFDALVRASTARLPRRLALRRGAAALVAGAGAAAAGHRATAQDASPVASPVAEGEDGSDLFVQSFQSGTLAPKPGEAGVYTLTLEGATTHTVYFSDRPARRVGLVPTAALLEQLGFTPADPPNAALVAQTEAGEEVVVVELFDPRSDEAAGTLTYDARILADYAGGGLADFAPREDGGPPAPAFETAHLFIDGCGRGQCWNGTVSMCVSCQCFQTGVQGCPCIGGTQSPCYDPAMQCETNPGSPPGSVGACYYP
jgi:hypothetical protein